MRRAISFSKKVIISLFIVFFVSNLNLNIQPVKPNIENDPEKVAIVYLNEKLPDYIYETRVENQGDGMTIVKFIDNNEKLAAKVGLAENHDKQWEVQWENIYE